MASPSCRRAFTGRLGGATGWTNVALVYFNILARQDPSSPYSGVLAKVLHRHAGRDAPLVFGDGEQTGILVSGQRRTSEFTGVEAPNVSEGRFQCWVGGRVSITRCGDQRTWKKSRARSCEAKYDPPRRRRHPPIRGGYFGSAGISWLMSPQVSLRKAWRGTFEWYRETQDKAAAKAEKS